MPSPKKPKGPKPTKSGSPMFKQTKMIEAMLMDASTPVEMRMDVMRQERHSPYFAYRMENPENQS